MNRDSIGNTFLVAISLCLVCSSLVALAAVCLRPIQERNKLLDRKKNILLVAQLYDPAEEGDVAEIFEARIDDRIIELATGDDVTDQYENPSAYDAEASLQSPDMGVDLASANDPAFLKRRELRAHVYVVKKSADDPTPVLYILPIRGKGLWSTLKGFIALDTDLRTVRGLTYYEHAETPGLGGEVDNPAWKQKWIGKQALNAEGAVVMRVVKMAQGDSAVDALAGATITSNGVQNMIEYWLGSEGFGPYLNKLRRDDAANTRSRSSRAGDTHG